MVDRRDFAEAEDATVEEFIYGVAPLGMAPWCGDHSPNIHLSRTAGLARVWSSSRENEGIRGEKRGGDEGCERPHRWVLTWNHLCLH